VLEKWFIFTIGFLIDNIRPIYIVGLCTMFQKVRTFHFFNDPVKNKLILIVLEKKFEEI